MRFKNTWFTHVEHFPEYRRIFEIDDRKRDKFGKVGFNTKIYASPTLEEPGVHCWHATPIANVQ